MTALVTLRRQIIEFAPNPTSKRRSAARANLDGLELGICVELFTITMLVGRPREKMVLASYL